MRQKFPMFSFIHVCKDMPYHMEHFESDFDGIVAGTYSQRYGGKDIGNYSIYMIKNNKVVRRISWYKENQLTLLPYQNKEKAEQMIENYNFR